MNRKDKVPTLGPDIWLGRITQPESTVNWSHLTRKRHFLSELVLLEEAIREKIKNPVLP